ncbi:MAG: hypothetical protein QOE90_1419 [Thermoplasmata archaeon]|jgi:hypothetical protein|nr:hypothetical protein [Thermoplasmata archaeon]
MRWLPVLLLALLAGCAAPFSPQGHGDVAPAAPAFLVTRLATAGTEPTLGVLRDGTILVGGALAPEGAAPRPESAGGEAVYRSRDGSHTWEDVLTKQAGTQPPADADPWLWVDERAGRVFDVPDEVVCGWLAWSDDAGASWSSNALAGCGLPGHDHQHLTTGPPAPGVTTSGYPDVVYYAYNSLRPGASTPTLNLSNPIFGSAPFEGTAVSVSLDGGRSFGLPVLAHAEDPCQSGNDGPVAVAADGTAYVAMPTCEGIDVAVSRDSGATWTTTASLDQHGSQLGLAMDPSLAVDPAGRVWLLYEGRDDLVYLASSADGGRSWSEPVVASAPGVRAAAFGLVAATGPGQVVIAYLGTPSDPAKWPSADPSDAPSDAVWTLHVASRGHDAQVTPDADPVQRGCIWTRGGSNPCRNLGDFMGLAVHDGRALVAYVDGCDACASADQSRRQDVMVAVEQG